MQPTLLGRYEVRDVLGRGNMGVVYRGHDPVIDRPVALKSVILPESVSPDDRTVFLERFFLEARAAGKLTHPNVVVTYDAATDETTGTPFIAMELVEGETLGAYLARRGALPWTEAIDIVIPIASGLLKAHEAGIVHRDIKPANIILGEDGAPKIADFGIAKLPASQLTQEGNIVGTPYFMSPEQLKGEPVDGRSDLFSLGAMLYNLVANRPPFEGADPATIFSQTLYKDPPPLSELVPEAPLALDRVLDRALAKKVTERYGTAAELVDDLRAVRAGDAPAHASEQAPGSAAPTLVSEGVSVGRDAPTVSTPVPAEARARELPEILRNRSVVAALAALVVVGAMAVIFRAALVREMRMWDARRGAAAGALVESEATLETVLVNEPELERGVVLLGDVSRELLSPHLPLTFSARHNHRLGNCNGTLTLGVSGLEYASRKHSWSFPFDTVHALESDWERNVTVTTGEDELMGLLDTKRYVFELRSEVLEREMWKRYHRIYESARLTMP